jgi:hypothetical protein
MPLRWNSTNSLASRLIGIARSHRQSSLNVKTGNQMCTIGGISSFYTLLFVVRMKSAVIDTGSVGNDGIVRQIISRTDHSIPLSTIMLLEPMWPENVVV